MTALNPDEGVGIRAGSGKVAVVAEHCDQVPQDFPFIFRQLG